MKTYIMSLFLVPCFSSTPASQSSVLSQYKNCPQHNSLVLALAAILQAVTISCPGALIWNSAPQNAAQANASANNEQAAKPAVLGSPLDRLPMAPSSLPTPSSNGHSFLTPEVKYRCLTCFKPV